MVLVKVVLLLLSVVLTGCSTIVQYPVTSASMAVWGTTGKTTTDHALSFVTGKDCVTLRIFSKYENEYICEDVIEQPVYELRGLDKLAKK
jgi:hypothetical protein